MSARAQLQNLSDDPALGGAFGVAVDELLKTRAGAGLGRKGDRKGRRLGIIGGFFFPRGADGGEEHFLVTRVIGFGCHDGRKNDVRKALFPQKLGEMPRVITPGDQKGAGLSLFPQDAPGVFHKGQVSLGHCRIEFFQRRFGRVEAGLGGNDVLEVSELGEFLVQKPLPRPRRELAGVPGPQRVLVRAHLDPESFFQKTRKPIDGAKDPRVARTQEFRVDGVFERVGFAENPGEVEVRRAPQILLVLPKLRVRRNVDPRLGRRFPDFPEERFAGGRQPTQIFEVVRQNIPKTGFFETPEQGFLFGAELFKIDFGLFTAHRLEFSELRKSAQPDTRPPREFRQRFKSRRGARRRSAYVAALFVRERFGRVQLVFHAPQRSPDPVKVAKDVFPVAGQLLVGQEVPVIKPRILDSDDLHGAGAREIEEFVAGDEAFEKQAAGGLLEDLGGNALADPRQRRVARRAFGEDQPDAVPLHQKIQRRREVLLAAHVGVRILDVDDQLAVRAFVDFADHHAGKRNLDAEGILKEPVLADRAGFGPRARSRHRGRRAEDLFSPERENQKRGDNPDERAAV